LQEVQLNAADEQVEQFTEQLSHVKEVVLAKVPEGHNDAVTHV
jgi:hypothetical protein